MFIPLNIILWMFIAFALCAEDYYKLLGVGKSATEKELKRAYRQLSKKYHPDKNPDNDSAKEKFVQVSNAYEALSNKETRQIYDQYGHEGLERHKQSGGRGGGAAHDPFDLFSRFFGGGGHFGGERKGPSMEVRVAVPLRDFYTGKDTEFSIEKQGICEKCSGSGSADGRMETCGQCGGRGMIVQKHMLAPGIFQQMQGPCDACGGQGQTIRHPCKTCGGHKVVMTTENFPLNVEAGMPIRHRILYENEANESPDYVAGDLIVQLAEQEPAMVKEEGANADGTFFRRRGKDLFWREVLSLREAWMGDWSRNLTHLDEHIVRLGRQRGDVVQPGMVEVVKGQGMPIWQDIDDAGEQQYGDLHIEYLVVLPDQMDKSMEKDFWGVWDKWRSKNGVDLHKDSGRPEIKHTEL